MTNGEGKVKSLQKSLEILNLFVEKPRWSVTEISKRLGLNKSNVHNILSTFKTMNYLTQDEETEKYGLGIGVYALCRSIGHDFNIRAIAIPFMQDLADKTGENVYLGIPDKDEVIYLEAVYPVEAFNLMRTVLGIRARMFCTGIGKAMLAHLPLKEQEDYISRELPVYTENTITDKEKLREELEIIRVRGYAVDNMEHEFGVKCVAMPIRNRDGHLVAAVSVSGPSLRFDAERIKEIVAILGECCRRIEERV